MTKSEKYMILVGLGANLPSRFGTPKETLQAAVKALEAHGVIVKNKSRIWLTAPVPYDPTQDWFHNAVVAVETTLSARELLTVLIEIEQEFGRVRTVKNAARLLDLDVIAYDNQIIKEEEHLIVPHERMHERLFVLKPLEDIDKKWTHPVSGQSVANMLHDLPKGQEAKPLEEAW